MSTMSKPKKFGLLFPPAPCHLTLNKTNITASRTRSPVQLIHRIILAGQGLDQVLAPVP